MQLMIELPPLPAPDADALALAACYRVARERARAARLVTQEQASQPKESEDARGE
jgi:hypothetical protein